MTKGQNNKGVVLLLKSQVHGHEFLRDVMARKQSRIAIFVSTSKNQNSEYDYRHGIRWKLSLLDFWKRCTSRKTWRSRNLDFK